MNGRLVSISVHCVSWSVEGFPDFVKGKEYRSPVFRLGKLDGGRWVMLMDPGFRDGYVSVLLVRLSGTVDTHRVLIRASIYKDGYLAHHSLPLVAFGHKHQLVLRREILSGTGYLINGSLTFHMKFWLYDSAEPDCYHPTQEIRQAVPSHIFRLASAPQETYGASLDASGIPTGDQLSIVFNMWHKDRVHANMAVKVEDKGYKIHKVVYATRSRVFDNMFKHDMSESNTGCIVLTDITPEVFTALDEYMYTGRVANIKNSAFDLMDVAEKYDLEELKSMCEASLIENVSKHTVLDLLVLADFYRALRLKTSALEFVKQHGRAVIASERWLSFVVEKPQLITELFSYVLPSNTTK